MNKTFKPSAFFKIPDDTWISPFLNSNDSMSDLPFDLIDGFSIAKGKVEGKPTSLIHVHPHVSQVTFVLSGKVVLKMKGMMDRNPYEIALESGNAGVTGKGEYFQIINPHSEECHVLYVVSPAYLFEMDNSKVIYDDALILIRSWEELEKLNWLPPELTTPENSFAARNNSYE